MSVARERDRVEITLGGCNRADLRDAALRLCSRRFGPDGWRVCDECFRPTMLSRTGSVRLWEGRFELERSA